MIATPPSRVRSSSLRASSLRGTDTAPGTCPAAYSRGRRTSINAEARVFVEPRLQLGDVDLPHPPQRPPGRIPRGDAAVQVSLDVFEPDARQTRHGFFRAALVLRDEDERSVRRKERARPGGKLSAKADVHGTFGMPRSEGCGRAHVHENRSRAGEALDLGR